MIPMIIGLDVGNGLLKTYSGIHGKWMAPNAIDYRCDLRLMEGHAEKADTWLDVEITQSPAVQKPSRFYLGDLAVRRGAAPRPLVTNKLGDPHTALVFVGALLRTVARQLLDMSPQRRSDYYRHSEGCYSVPLVVGVGAPIHQYDDATAKKLFASRVKGAHRGRFVTTPEYRELGPIRIDVQRIMLYQEGVSALADYRYHDNGTLRRPAELPYYVAVIDCGNNTLDWATTRPDGALDPLLTGGRDFGLADAMEQLTTTINAQFRTSYTRAQLVEVLVANDYHVPQGRDLVPVMDLAQTYLARVGDEVIAVLQRLVRDSQNRIGLVLLAGGGAAALRPFLSPALDSLRGIDVEFMPDPLFCNAAGYYKRTMSKLMQERTLHA